MESLVVFLPCYSLETTIHFYTEIVGLKFYMDQGGCVIFDSGKGYLGFTENKEQVEHNHPCISFNLSSIEQVDEYYEIMKTKCVEHLTFPQRHPRFPVYSFFFTDPNGYTIEFQKIIMEDHYGN